MQTFSLKRFGLLIREQILLQAQSVLFVGLSLGLGLFLLGLFFSGTGHFYNEVYVWVLLGGEFILLKNAFINWRDPQQNYRLLTLPATNLEKFLAKLTLTSVGYIVGITALFYVVHWLVCGAQQLLLSGPSAQVFFIPKILTYIKIYLLIHAAFFLGGIYFKRNVLSKTVLSLLLLSLLLSIGFVVLFYLITILFLHGGAIFSLGTLFKIYAHMFYNLLVFILVQFCWLVAYLRFRELETV